MFAKLTTRAALAGTASVAVLGLGIAILSPGMLPTGPLGRVETGRVEPLPAPRAEIETAAPPAAPTELELAAPALPAAAGDARQAGSAAPKVEGLRAGQEAAPMADIAAAPVPGAVERMVAEEDVATVRRERSPSPTESAAGMAQGAAPAGSFATAVAPQSEPMMLLPAPDTEAYPQATPNPLKITAEEPVSTFSIDVDTASYAVIRSSLNSGYLPPPEAVRIEEMVNYFPYDWPAPAAGEAPFRPSVSVMQTPWNADTRLVTVALQGRMPAIDERPPLNLVFLIDTSGSMQDQNKLPLLKQSFRLMLSELRPEDRIAIVTYAGSAGQVLAPTPASDRATILAALDRLEAGGSTAGQAGLAQAYATARGMAEDGEVTRVLLATDGDFNVGIADPEALKDVIARERASGIYLSVLGFGRGNLDDATMQALAQNGNGQAAYIDTLNEARKVLVDQLSGALFPIADDVKVQIEWNPATVSEYRLIGYETRALAREDFANDRVDAGEIGAGHSVTAIYEITPAGAPSRAAEPLRYGVAAAPEAAAPATRFADELGFLRLRYKEPGEATSRLIETPIPVESAGAGREARFAAAIAGMGQLLTEPKYLGQWGWDEAIALANSARGEDPFGYRAEAVNLMRLAQSLAR